MDRLEPKVVALSLASISALFYVACVLFLMAVPGAGVRFFANMFHGIDLTQIAAGSVSLGNAVVGLIELVILAFIIGWLFAAIYNAFARRK